MDLRPPRWTLLLPAVLAAGMLLLWQAIGPSSSTATHSCAMGLEMAIPGDIVVPTLNGAPRLDKPPRLHRCASTAFRRLGIGDVAARFAQRLAATIVLLVTAWTARRLAPEGVDGRRRGALAARALGTMPSFLVPAYAIAPDIWLLLSTTTAGAALLEVGRAPGRAPRRWALLLHGAMGLPWSPRGEVPLLGCPSDPMMVAPEDHRPDLFRPLAEREPWLRGPGRRWWMLRTCDPPALTSAGVPLTTVAVVRECVLVATKPPDGPP